MSPLACSGRGMRRRRRHMGPRQLFVLVLALVLATTASGRSASGVLEDGDAAQVRHWQETPAGTSRRKKAAVNPPSPLSQRPPTTLEHLVAGTVGGISGALVSYPLDTVRVRMQTGGKHFGAARTASLLMQEAGVAGFYRGVMSPVVGAGLIKAAVFGGYGLFQGIVRRVSGKDGEELTLGHLGAAAMGSGLVGSFVVTPVERIKVVMQAALASAPSPSKGPHAAAAAAAAAAAVTGGGGGAGGASYSNAWGCARGLVSENGLRKGLYAGLGPTLLREVPGYAFYFATYEACKRVLLREPADGREEDSRGTVMFKTAMSGALAGIAAWLPVYPADVVKSRMQSTGGGAGGGMLATATSMWKTEGFTPFYRGLAPTLARAAVNHAATFLVYEATMEWMRTGERQKLARELEVAGGEA